MMIGMKETEINMRIYTWISVRDKKEVEINI